MGILKDAILDALKEQGVKAEWIGEKPRVLKTAAQSKYDDCLLYTSDAADE